ncbi:MAG: hypothetical protein ACP5O6_09160 [Candidatus Baltobacteraceae bacterium]
MYTRSIVPPPARSTRLCSVVSIAALLLSACSGPAAAPAGWTALSPEVWSSVTHPGERVSASRMPFRGAPSDLASHILESVVLARGAAKMVGTNAMKECPGMAGEIDFLQKSPPRRIVVFFSIRNDTAYQIRWSGAPGDALPPEVLAFAESRLCRVL